MAFAPEQLRSGTAPFIVEVDTDSGSDSTWHPLFLHACTFGPDDFVAVMLNLIRNPNLNSSWLFRADILSDEVSDQESQTGQKKADEEKLLAPQPHIPTFLGFVRKRCLVRRLVPRNTSRDKPLDQTCLVYGSGDYGDALGGGDQQTLVIYLPHVSGEADVPFYHPKVRGIAFRHLWFPGPGNGSVSISYLFFDHDDGGSRPTKLVRTALNLLSVLYKHGQGKVEGYVKRVQHDVLVPQAAVQNRYTALKEKHAGALVKSWAETTDPYKHVFEDLCIAAFLIELWAGMYSSEIAAFPGFVDIGCGNGLLVYILNREGFRGRGFDARARKSWDAYNAQVDSPTGPADSLQQLVLLPSAAAATAQLGDMDDEPGGSSVGVHNGRFPKGTFIISNHADELTPWTPILAAASDCPFIMIPCCSHNLAGNRYRAPASKVTSRSKSASASASASVSAYSSLVAWVTEIAADCGWVPEREMLRIPSTRNTAILGRKRCCDAASVDIPAVVAKHGGAAGYYENAIRLVKTAPRGH